MPKPGQSMVVPHDGNREEWLTELARMVEPIFHGFVLAPYRLTCGWPSRHALGKKVRALGECHAPVSSKGGIHEIFISPIMDKPLEVSGTVCHEMAHVAAGVKAQHKGLFVKVRKHIGLTKHKPTHAMPGPELELKLLKITEKLGVYPHHALAPQLEVKEKKKTELAMECPGCGCLVRITTKWLSVSGPPTCGCGEQMTEKDQDG